MSVYNWNPVFILVMQIKSNYKEKFGSIDSIKFEDWLSRLASKEYNSIFCHLKVKQHNNFILIRYGMDEMHESMWTNPESIYRECRSVVDDFGEP
jgi:hypothetical protein